MGGSTPVLLAPGRVNQCYNWPKALDVVAVKAYDKGTQDKRPMTFAILPSSCETFDDYFAEFFSDLAEARDAAFDWSVELSGLPVVVWRLTQGNPIKWMEIVA